MGLTDAERPRSCDMRGVHARGACAVSQTRKRARRRTTCNVRDSAARLHAASVRFHVALASSAHGHPRRARASSDRKNKRVDKHNIYFLRVCIYILYMYGNYDNSVTTTMTTPVAMVAMAFLYFSV